MTDDTQPEAMDLADWLEAVGGGPSAKRCAALLREQHTRIAELESELEAVGAGGVSGPLMGRASLQSPGFDAADVATASAQGFRDGVASLSANAGGAVVSRATVIEWLDANDIEVTDRQLGGLFHFSAPPTAQAEGWVSVEERLPPVRTTVFIASGAGSSAWRTLAFYDPDRYTPAWRCNDDPSEGIRGVSHWMHMPLPPTSAEGVEHG